MKTITLKMIIDEMKSHSSTNRGLAIFLIIIIILLTSGLFVVNPFIALLGAVLVIAFAFGTFKTLQESRRTRLSVKKRDFFIISSNCSDKDITYDSDGDVYNLTFQNGAKVIMSIGNTVFWGDPNAKILSDAYSGTLPGDSFYLVYENENDTPLFIIPQKYCQLDMRGFWDDGGIIRPIKSK